MATLVPEAFREIILSVTESGGGGGGEGGLSRGEKFQEKSTGPGYLRSKHFRASPSRKLTRCEIEGRRGRGRGALTPPPPF